LYRWEIPANELKVEEGTLVFVSIPEYGIDKTIFVEKETKTRISETCCEQSLARDPRERGANSDV
jgi:hypothetical protein